MTRSDSPVSRLPDARCAALQRWFGQLTPTERGGELQGDLVTVSGDASFRRYFRARTDVGSRILVDAPPDREDSRPFVAVAGLLATAGVAVPQVYAADLAAGFMCLADFGDTALWKPLDAARRTADFRAAGQLYQSAFAELLRIQRCPALALAPYDANLLLRELRLFPEWFCGGLLKLKLTAQEQDLLETAFTFLVDAALAQQQAFVHRDYHSRNLMFRPAEPPGVLDFQDAVGGPVTYDLVSLLRDCYIEWPPAQVHAWALDYLRQAQVAGVVDSTLAPARWLHDFDLMGAQRHIKVLGIFSRLCLRDGKAAYLRDIPLTLRYLLAVVPMHPQLAGFSRWLQTRVVPMLDAALARAGGSA